MKKEDPTFLNSGQGHYRPTEQLSGVGWEVISGSVIFVNKTVSRMDFTKLAITSYIYTLSK